MVYDIMMEFHLSKNQVLQEIFVREIPLITHKLKLEAKRRSLTKLYEQKASLIISTITAGMGPSGEVIKEFMENLDRQIERLENRPEQKQDPYEQLKKLSATIASKKGR